MADSPDCVVLGGYLPDTTIILREAYQLGEDVKFIAPHWALGSELVETIGAEAVEGVQTASAVLTADNPSISLYDELFQLTTGNPGDSNAYAAMCFDMVNVLAYAMDAAGAGASRAEINAQIRNVANQPGEVVYDYVSGREQLASGAVDFSGASSSLNFDEAGDDTGALFSWDVYVDGAFQSRDTIGLG